MSFNPLTPALSPTEGADGTAVQGNNRPPAIEMHGVGVRSMRDADVMVAEQIEWTVNAGEFWAVGGPQRSGKSDLLMLAAGLMPPAGGTYRFFGEEMPIFEEERMAERLKLGFVFDGGQLFSQMTIAENVALPLRYHQNLSRDAVEPRVRALLELTGLLPYANSTPGGVARNWQKRAGLARALSLQPEVLLLDEPLAGLDARQAHWWLNFLEQLCVGHTFMGGQPVTVVLTADDLSRLATGHGPAYRFALIHEKRFQVIGGREELARCPDAVVKELVAGD